MKSKAISFSIATAILLFAQVSKAQQIQMRKSATHIDVASIIDAAQETKEIETEVKNVIDRSPSSFGEVTYVEVKKTKFEDIVPSMEEFNLMQQQMEKSDSLVAH